VRGDQSVGVTWVSNNEDFAGLLGNLIEGLTLSLEDFGVGSEKISSFHSWASWSSSNEDGGITILEAILWVGAWDNGVDAGVSTIHKFHSKSLEWTFSGWELDELEDDLLVWSEHSSLRDEVAEERSNLASSSSNSNSDRWRLKVEWWVWEVSSESLNSRYKNRFVHC